MTRTPQSSIPVDAVGGCKEEKSLKAQADGVSIANYTLLIHIVTCWPTVYIGVNLHRK